MIFSHVEVFRMDYKTRIEASIQEHLDAYMEIVKTLYKNPETGFQEYETQKVLVKYLKDAGFDVKSSVVIDTDFVAEYKSGKEGPTIAYMCEYDALPEVGHGCGHNLIAGIGIAAGEALKSVVDEIGGTVRVVGTPGEENFGGKVKMSEAGVFDDVDAANNSSFSIDKVYGFNRLISEINRLYLFNPGSFSKYVSTSANFKSSTSKKAC